MSASTAEFRILGPLDVRFGGRPVDLGAPKQRALLVVLLINANRTVSIDHLLDCLWGGDPPGDGVKALRFHVSRLRASLREASPELAAQLVTQPAGYRLDVDESEIDACRFTEVVRKARRLVEFAPAEAASRLAGALAEWCGPALADVAFEEFAQSEIRRLDELRLGALVDRIGADLAAGAGGELVGEVESLVDEYPTNEQLWAHLMLALHRAGRTQEALEAFQRARDRLVDSGLSPSEPIVTLESRIGADDPALRPDDPSSAPGLPAPVTELIGREGDLARVAGALASRRLVTLTGPGGVGKTRVAIEAAHAVARSGQPVAWVELDSVDDSSLVASQLAVALGVGIRGDGDAVASLRAHLRLRPIVVVFDDCDRVIGGVADLATRLVVACPEIAILSTSREALRAVGEQVIPIGPLPVPEEYSTSANAGPAVELFVSRARDIDPNFAPSDRDALVISRICCKLDGLPLAIELAAAHIGVMTPPELAARLDGSFGILTSRRRGGVERHHSLIATLRWSYDQLTPHEQLLLGRLSVLSGPFRVMDAESICGFGEIEPAAVLVLLSELVAKSLAARRGGSASASFQLLDSVKEFAALTLERRSETDALADRHADHFASAAATIRTLRPDLEHLAVIEPDIIQAIDHLIARGDWASAAGVLRSCSAKLLEIGRADRVFQRASALLPHAGELPPLLRGTVLWGAANVTDHLDQDIELLRAAVDTFAAAGLPTAGTRSDLAQRFLERGMLEDSVELYELSLAETLHNPGQLGRTTEWSCRWGLANALIRSGRLDEARHHLDRCGEAAAETHWEYHGEADMEFAELLRLEGDLTGAHDLLVQRIGTLERWPYLDPLFDGCLHAGLARIELALGLGDEAHAHIRHSLERLATSLDTDACDALAVAAAVAETIGDWYTAAFIVGGLAAWTERRGLIARPDTMSLIEPAAAGERSALDPARFAVESASGASASLIELIERFLATTH